MKAAILPKANEKSDSYLANAVKSGPANSSKKPPSRIQREAGQDEVMKVQAKRSSNGCLAGQRSTYIPLGDDMHDGPKNFRAT